MSNWCSNTWKPPSSNTSYFQNIDAAREQAIRNEVTVQIKNEAEQVIHNIVTQKDSEIANLKTQIKELQNGLDGIKEESVKKYKIRIDNQQKEIESLKREKRHFNIPNEPEFIPGDPGKFIEATIDQFAESIIDIFKYGKSVQGFKRGDLEKIRKVVLSWKCFLEEYKWKSNYISVKIKKLLKDTDIILNN